MAAGPTQSWIAGGISIGVSRPTASLLPTTLGGQVDTIAHSDERIFVRVRVVP